VFLPVRDYLPSRSVPLVNYGLILVNVYVYFALAVPSVIDSHGSSAFDRQWSFVPGNVFVNPAATIVTVFTSMFLHASLGHLGGNMLFLWIFGDNVEDAIGHVRYLAFYLAGGVCAAVAQAIPDPTSMVPMVGASGAISAVLAAYALLYPRSPIAVFNGIIIMWFFWGPFLYVPAWLVIGLYFVVNLGDALVSNAQGGVAFMAHVGGFVGGAVLLRSLMAGRERMDQYARWQGWTQQRARQRDRLD
jgi:membrane associated rhomboid family serine protease